MPPATGRALFLSYAREDADATRRIADALRAAGVEVWFDQNELRGGDAWDAKIRKQTKECTLFLPIISANTQSRPEGYFRLEWHLAEQRSHLIAQGRPFIVPICVDDTPEADALVPDVFLAVQWMRLPAGNADDAFCDHVKSLLSGSGPDAGRSRAPLHGATVSPLPKPANSGPKWMRPVLASAVILVVVLAVTLVERTKNPTPAKRSPPSPATSTLSPARDLLRRARLILDQPSLTREQLDAAGDLCEHALQLEPTDALIWASAADVDLRYIYPYGYDRSDARRRRAQERIARAASLDPSPFEVRLIQAEVFAHAVGTPALLAEAEKTIRDLRSNLSGDKELVRDRELELDRQLAEVLRDGHRYEEAAQLFEKVREFEVAAWSYFQGGQLRRALNAIDRAPRSITALHLKTILEWSVNEDLAAAQAAIDQFQPSQLLTEMPAVTGMRVALFRRDSQRLLEIGRGLSSDFLDSNAFRGPRGYFIGWAHEIAHQRPQAEAQWRAALSLIQTRLAATPDDRELLLWSAWLHAALQEMPEAERAFSRSQILGGLSGDEMDLNFRQPSMIHVLILARLHKTEALLNGLEKAFRGKEPTWEQLHAEFRFNPDFDFLRGDPRFEQLLRDNLPDGAKPFSAK